MMLPDLSLKNGTVLQFNPETCRDQTLAGCLLVMTQAKPWGAIGYVQCVGASDAKGDQAYCRVPWNELEQLPDGMAVWVGEDCQEQPV